jgi:aromatic-L-amino-acid decarboxylase
MLWQTSPAATEMETRMLDWLRQALGLPEGFTGVIQDSASSATLAAVLTMRERALDWQGNVDGLPGQVHGCGSMPRPRCTARIDRAIWISGIGQDNLVRVPIAGRPARHGPGGAAPRDRGGSRGGASAGGLILSVGATGTGARSGIDACSPIAQAEGLYTHVDAAWAGAAMICPEYPALWQGWTGPTALSSTRTSGWARSSTARRISCATRTRCAHAGDQPGIPQDPRRRGIINYSEWSIPLGRRFRALKLWFLIRAYGLDGLRARIRNHVAWSGRAACTRLEATAGFEIVTRADVVALHLPLRAGRRADLDALNLRW